MGVQFLDGGTKTGKFGGQQQIRGTAQFSDHHPQSKLFALSSNGNRYTIPGIRAAKQADAWGHSRMDEIKIDPAAMGRLAKALAFIRGADDPTVLALKAAAESGSEQDIAKARKLFLKLKPGDRRAALTMLAG